MAVVGESVTINGYDMAGLGMIWERRTGYRSSPESNILYHERPTRESVFEAAYAVRPRVVTLSGFVLADTVTQLWNRLDEIAWRLQGEQQISFSDDSSRYVIGYTQRWDVGDAEGGVLIPAAPFDLEFLCPDPRRWGSLESNNGSSCPIGTAFVHPQVTVTSPTYPLTVEVKDKDGTTVKTCSIASGSGTAVIDGDTGQVTVGGATAVSDFTGELPILRPTDSDFSASSWGSVVASSGTVQVDYRKAWW